MVEKEKKLVLQIVLLTIAWAAFFMLPFVFFPYNRNNSPLKSLRFIYMFITSNTLLIVFYYLNSWFFIPSLLARKKTFYYVVSVLSCLFIYLSALYVIDISSRETKIWLQSDVAKKLHSTGPHFFAAGPLTLFLLAFIVSSGSKVIAKWFVAEETREEISRQQLQTELSLLKSQVNPHFLFNTLNGIYSLSVGNSTRTPDAVMKLSRIMRYTLEESKNDFVTLSQEIGFINNYIELQKIRLTENISVCFNVSEDVKNVKISPLLFIPFIENAFKYGISTHHHSKISVDISVKDSVLQFFCTNDVVPSSGMKPKGTGTGINNTRRRLELLYANKHELVIKNSEQQYAVSLTINTSL